MDVYDNIQISTFQLFLGKNKEARKRNMLKRLLARIQYNPLRFSLGICSVTQEPLQLLIG